mmetsp:Transcript_41903/g.48917  ORF Transcript_41903/g.48917 Transcript_41903/m.48917 type:complete len:202 (+) Transcript_41903:359-964(+)
MDERATYSISSSSRDRLPFFCLADSLRGNPVVASSSPTSLSSIVHPTNTLPFPSPPPPPSSYPYSVSAVRLCIRWWCTRVPSTPPPSRHRSDGSITTLDRGFMCGRHAFTASLLPDTLSIRISVMLRRVVAVSDPVFGVINNRVTHPSSSSTSHPYRAFKHCSVPSSSPTAKNTCTNSRSNVVSNLTSIGIPPRGSKCFGW